MRLIQHVHKLTIHCASYEAADYVVQAIRTRLGSEVVVNQNQGNVTVSLHALNSVMPMSSVCLIIGEAIERSVIFDSKIASSNAIIRSLINGRQAESSDQD